MARLHSLVLALIPCACASLAVTEPERTDDDVGGAAGTAGSASQAVGGTASGGTAGAASAPGAAGTTTLIVQPSEGGSGAGTSEGSGGDSGGVSTSGGSSSSGGTGATNAGGAPSNSDCETSFVWTPATPCTLTAGDYIEYDGLVYVTVYTISYCQADCVPGNSAAWCTGQQEFELVPECNP